MPARAMKAPGAVIFDMDGLLLDTERLCLTAARQASQEHSVDIPDSVWFSMVGRRVNACQEILQAALDGNPVWKPIWERANGLYHDWVDSGKLELKPGVQELITYLDANNIPWGIGTSTETPFAKKKLSAKGIENVRCLIGGDQVNAGKPEPEVFLKVALCLGALPEDCVVLEDSGPGIQAAHRAGMRPVLIPDLKMPDPEICKLAHEVFSSLNEFLDAITP